MDKLEDIFARQAFYVASLREIYLRNGFTIHACPMPWHINDRLMQEEFRLLAWRFTEEIIEAVEVVDKGIRNIPALNDYHEEVADALHFFVELCLATDITPAILLTGSREMPWISKGDHLDDFFKHVEKTRLKLTENGNTSWADVIRAMALVMMELRQRPWRTDDRPTNTKKWVMGMHLVFRSFVQCCIDSGIEAVDLHLAYFKKAKINDKRTKEQPRA